MYPRFQQRVASTFAYCLIKRYLHRTMQKRQADTLTAIKKKFTTAYYWSRCNFYIIAFLLILLLSSCSSSCGLPLPSGGGDTATPTPLVTPIAASFTPARLLQACFDTDPIVSDSLFKAAVNRVADMLESPGTVNVNEGQITAYFSYIVGTNSYLKDAFSFSVPAMRADENTVALSPTPDPAKFHNQYDYANAQASVTTANATPIALQQAQLQSNHMALTNALALVRKNAEKLRTLPNVHDSSLEDVKGCLQAASERFQSFQGRKTLIIASPLVHMLDSTTGINLSGVHVEVIFKTCQLASSDACIASAASWKQTFLSLGASQVSISDPQASLNDTLSF